MTFARRPPPPAWVTAEVVAERQAEAHRKFMAWAVRKAAALRGAQAAEADAALAADGGTPGASLSELVPEIPWHRAAFVNAPVKGSDRLDIDMFFSKLHDGLPAVTGTRLWEAFADAGSDVFAFFKVSGMAHADGRCFTMFRLGDALIGANRVRLVVPQKRQHLVVMSLEDYMASAL